MKMQSLSKYTVKIIIILFFLSFNNIFSQDTKTPQTKEEGEIEEELKAIPVIEIPQRIEEGYLTIKEIQSLITSEVSVKKQMDVHINEQTNPGKSTSDEEDKS